MNLTLYERIKFLCGDKSVTLAKLQSDLGFSASTIKTWKNGITPSADKVLKIAQYFGVTTDYLLGSTDVPSTVEDFVGDNDIVSLQRARAKMSQRDRDRMMKMIKIGFDYAFEDDEND